MSTNKNFTASNGTTVGNSFGWLVVTDPSPGVGATKLARLDVDALREYFQHRRDEELGRWRNPDRPNEVVYPQANGNIRVLDESNGRNLGWGREEALDKAFAHRLGMATARAYYAVHPEPEPKPWEEAQFGEAWLLNLHGDEGVAVASATPYGTPVFFMAYDTEVSPDSPRITAGRRIWPADAEGDGDTIRVTGPAA